MRQRLRRGVLPRRPESPAAQAGPRDFISGKTYIVVATNAFGRASTRPTSARLFTSISTARPRPITKRLTGWPRRQASDRHPLRSRMTDSSGSSSSERLPARARRHRVYDVLRSTREPRRPAWSRSGSRPVSRSGVQSRRACFVVTTWSPVPRAETPSAE